MQGATKVRRQFRAYQRKDDIGRWQLLLSSLVILTNLCKELALFGRKGTLIHTNTLTVKLISYILKKFWKQHEHKFWKVNSSSTICLNRFSSNVTDQRWRVVLDLHVSFSFYSNIIWCIVSQMVKVFLNLSHYYIVLVYYCVVVFLLTHLT